MSSSPRPASGADVARLAGVSKATVSFVLNDTPGQTIPRATKDRVLAAAAELGYLPSPTARSLSTGRSSLVLGLYSPLMVSPLMYRSFLELDRNLRARGLLLLTRPYDASTESMGALWKSIRPAAVFAFADIADHDVTSMLAAGISVTVGLGSTRPSRPWQMSWGDRSIGWAQADHLARLGHRRVTFAVPDRLRGLDIVSGRLAGLQEGLSKAQGAVLSTLHVPVAEGADQSQLLHWVRQERATSAATAVAAWNDAIAASVMQAAQDEGLHVPQDLAVLGAYDDLLGRFVQPRLSTITVDVPARMTVLADHIATAVAGDESTLHPFDMSTTQVVARGST